MRFAIASLVALAASVSAQGNLSTSLRASLSDRDDVDLFNVLLTWFPNALDEIIADAKRNDSSFLSEGVTILIPDDEALNIFLQEENVQPQDLDASLVKSTLSYHIMVKPLKEEELIEPRGLTVPTLLDGKNELGTSFNLRAPAPQIQADFGEQATGQVLFAKLDSIDNVVRIKTRQDDEQTTQLNLRGGEAKTAEMTIVDGVWDGGVYQIVNSVLVPPKPCSNTIRGLSGTLTALDSALNRTDLWETLNTSPNVTCLAPNDQAFSNANNPQQSLNEDELKTALLDHTLHGPAYSNYLADGMRLSTVSKKQVLVSVNDSGIFFNDARVLQSNVLTNNGLIHVLDRVMTVSDSADADSEEDNGDDESSSNDSEDGSEAANEDDDDGGNAAGVVGVNNLLMGLVGAAAIALF